MVELIVLKGDGSGGGRGSDSCGSDSGVVQNVKLGWGADKTRERADVR